MATVDEQPEPQPRAAMDRIRAVLKSASSRIAQPWRARAIRRATIGMVSGLAAFATTAFLLPAAMASDPLPVPYPEGYRHWTHIKSAYVGKASPAFERFGGLHYIYANARALEGYRTGRFPVGSVLVFDVLDASSTDQGVEPGPRKFIDVMWKRTEGSGRGDGWIFGEFDRDSRTKRNVTTEQGVVQCQACHTAAAAATDGVFSKFVP